MANAASPHLHDPVGGTTSEYCPGTACCYAAAMAAADQVTANEWVLALNGKGWTRRLRGAAADAIQQAGLLLSRSERSGARRAADLLRRLALRFANDIFFHPAQAAAKPSGRRILIASHQLDRTGAPKIVFELAAIAIAQGYAVTVVAPSDGPFREDLNSIGADVVLAPSMIYWQRSYLAKAAQVFDLAICNTIVVWKLAEALSKRIPTLMYVHEVSILEEAFEQEPEIRSFLRSADIWCGSELSAELIRPLQPAVAVVPYGVDRIEQVGQEQRQRAPGEPVEIGIFGSIHPRKGQDLAVRAVSLLPPEIRSLIRLRLYGEDFRNDYSAQLFASLTPTITYEGALEPDSYRRAVLACDAVLVSSRDDTLPLVSLDALGCGRVLMCTSTTGTSLYLEHGASGYIAEGATAEAISAMLAEAIAARQQWPAIGARGRNVFDQNFSKDRFQQIVVQMIERKAAEAA